MHFYRALSLKGLKLRLTSPSDNEWILAAPEESYVKGGCDVVGCDNDSRSALIRLTVNEDCITNGPSSGSHIPSHYLMSLQNADDAQQIWGVDATGIMIH